MQRDIYEAEHDSFRELCRDFMATYVAPYHEEWERAGMVDRSVWIEAGKHGLLGTDVPEVYGGGGIDDFRYQAVLGEETLRIGASGIGFGLHNDIVAPYLLELATEEQKARWLPGFCAGETITAIAMTEPAAGSDLQGIKSSAVRDGDSYVLNGSKTFITNGIHSDLVIVVAKTDAAAGYQGISLLVVERGMEGFERGRKLDKIGLRAQDTAELYFTDVRVPRENLLGEEGNGFVYLMERLPRERLSIAIAGMAAARSMLDLTLGYVRERKAFGRSIGSFQHVRFELAEMATQVEVGQAFVDKAVLALNAGTLSAVDAAMAKWWATDLQNRVADRCLQLHGGYGYMMEYPIAKGFVDSRVTSIYGGTNEIMKEIIGRSLEV
jgi:alkylation response protein AidB-like acyl-CoA dehydrogenase